MKIFYLVLMMIISLGLLVSIVRTTMKKNELSFSIAFLCIWVLFVMINSFLSCYTVDEDLAYFTRGMYYAGLDWMLMGAVRFVVDYSKNFRVVKPAVATLLGLCFADVICMGINTITHFSFELQKFTYRQGWEYYDIAVRRWPFVAHQVFMVILVAIATLVMMSKISSSSRLYRKTYWLFAVIFFLAIMMDALFYATKYPLKISVLFYGILGIMVYYFAMEYTHHDVINSSLELLLRNAGDAIVLFDVHQRLIYINDKAKDILRIKDDDYSVAIETNRELIDKYKDSKQEMIHELYEEVIDGRKHFFDRIVYFLQDEQGYPIGNSFVVTDKTEEYKKMDREHYMLTHDDLTGLYNMERFGEVTRAMFEEYPDTEFCMVCSNIKDFKLINDLFGMHKGDEVLLMQSSLMTKLVSTPGTYGRIGADMFAVCMPKERFDPKIFEDCMKMMENEYTSSVYRMHVYIGVYNIRDKQEPVSIMCDRCFMAINSIAGDYTTSVVYCQDELLQKAAEENKLLGEFETAIEEKQFVMYLQPQIGENSQLLGAEALVRWEHPIYGFVGPDRFLPAFEKAALIPRLDMYVWEEAVKRLKRWKELGHEELYISVNVSVKDFFYLDIYQVFTELVEKYQVDPKRLNIEITESVFLFDLKSRMELFRRLQEYGFRIELDDFGSGYSSLNLLKEIQADGLKIDRSFLADAVTDERGQKVLKNIFTLANDLEMSVVTEGVETEDQVQLIKNLGGKCMQGFYYDKPMSAKNYELKYKLL